MVRIGNDKMNQFEKMTTTPIPRLIVSLSIPTVITMMVTNIYNLVDTAFVGELGNSASGAVGVVFGFMSILQAIGFMFGQGGGSLLSRKLGEKKEQEASCYASTGFFFSYGFGALVAIICFFNIDWVIKIIGSTETIAPYAKTYIMFMLMTAPCVTAQFTLNNLLRYEGKATLGMVGIMSGAVLNIVGDYIFMKVLDMGIAGAGLSTAISQSVGFFVLLYMFTSGRTTSKLSFESIRWNGNIFEVMSTGFPSLLRQILNSVATIVLNYQAGLVGKDEAVAAMSIVSRVLFFVFSVAIGIGQGFQPVSAFNYGAGKYKRLREAFRYTVLLSEVILLVILSGVFIFAKDIARPFRDDEQVIHIAVRAMRLQCIGQIFMPLCMTTEMLMQSTGKKLAASVLSAMRSGIFFIPCIIILARFRGIAGIQEAQPLAFVISFIPSAYMAIRYFKNLPKEKEVF